MPEGSNRIGLSRARKSIQEAIEAAEADRKRKLLAQRIDIARSGVTAYNSRKIPEAVKYFHTYLKILEDGKECGEHGLLPSMFDVTKDANELILLSGVYWDLAKLYDRTKSGEKYAEFKIYLDKFILFSKGMSYQTLCAETLRKYISNEKPVHREDFKNAYRMIAQNKCFVATSLVDVCREPTIPALRAFRDGFLLERSWGRVLVGAYYRIGPAVARALDMSPSSFRKAIGRVLDALALRISGSAGRSGQL